MQLLYAFCVPDYEARAQSKIGHRRESAESRRTVRLKAKGNRWNKKMEEKRKKRERREDELRNNPFYVPIASAKEGLKRRIQGGGMNRQDEWGMRRIKLSKEKRKRFDALPRPRNVEAYNCRTTGSSDDEPNVVSYSSPLHWSTSETEVLLQPKLVLY